VEGAGEHEDQPPSVVMTGGTANAIRSTEVT